MSDEPKVKFVTQFKEYVTPFTGPPGHPDDYMVPRYIVDIRARLDAIERELTAVLALLERLIE